MTSNGPPSCFGRMEIVFPVSEDGLRHSPETCQACRHKTDCLRTAMKCKAGLEMQEEKVDQAYASGMVGFLERWSKKKDLQRKLKVAEKNKP